MKKIAFDIEPSASGISNARLMALLAVSFVGAAERRLAKGQTECLGSCQLDDERNCKDRLSQLSTKESNVDREARQQPLEEAHDRKNFAFRRAASSGQAQRLAAQVAVVG